MTLDALVEFAGRNPMLSLAFVGLTLALIYTEIARLMRGFKGLSPAQLTEWINRENAVVIDIRGQGEFEKGHIAGSKHQLPSQFDPEAKWLVKAKEQPVVVVCATGMTAGGVAARLVKAGYQRVAVLEGGIAAWQQASLPLTAGRA
ncbi:MAG TPA: rhodanese-like domain-containing protein [Arenimonas sp.]|nr:rhodanese-like domain-containing protein [Arenimonas sp.]